MNASLVSEHLSPRLDVVRIAAVADQRVCLYDMQDVIEGKDYSFPKQEEQVLRFWDDTHAFQQQLKRSEGKKPYVFYDGPPFATGLPHYGHLLAGTLKVSSLRGASLNKHGSVKSVC